MHKFLVDSEKCVSCGSCARDCPVSVLEIRNGNPVFAHPERCVGCLHCYAICPTGAITMDGLTPAMAPVAGNLPTADNVEAFIRQRRSIRSFKRENIAPETFRRMLEMAWSAPSGGNQHLLQLSVIDDLNEMDIIREKTYSTIADRMRKGTFGDKWLLAYLGASPAQWLENDVIFRGAPHFVIVSCSKSAITGIPDCFIYLSYLEMLACASGFGTLWCNILYRLPRLAPELTDLFGIPDDHEIGYAMLLGIPSVHYARGLERHDAKIHVIGQTK